MKFWSNLGLVRTLKLGEFKENRSLSFRDIGVRDSRRHTQYGQYGPFSSQSVLKVSPVSQSVSPFSFSVIVSKLSNMRTVNLKMAHTVHIRYGVGYLEHRYLEN